MSSYFEDWKHNQENGTPPDEDERPTQDNGLSWEDVCRIEKEKIESEQSIFAQLYITNLRQHA